MSKVATAEPTRANDAEHGQGTGPRIPSPALSPEIPDAELECIALGASQSETMTET